MKRTLPTYAIALPLLLAVACGGDEGGEATRVLFSRAMIVSAYPAQRLDDGRWVRQCGPGAVDGIVTDVALISTQRDQGGSRGPDRDLQIHPGDVIDGRVVGGGQADDISLTGEGALALTLDCITPQPQANPGEGGCQGVSAASSTEATSYIAHTQRRVGHNVLMLIDQSGSIEGLVDDAQGDIEARPGDFTVPDGFGSLASDPSNLRLAAARRFLRTLNGEDRFGALAFSEKLRLRVPCAEAQGAPQDDLDRCFGAPDDALWLAPEGLDSLISRAEGRSNLWEAVDFAYGYLRALGDTERSNHIVVLTDGPDTCASSLAMGACQSSCSDTSAQEVLDRIEADQGDPSAPKIHVHFIQFESLGYPGRDPRQIALSCASGGEYQYVNTNDFPHFEAQQFQEALETAVINVRYMLMGHWQIAARVPAYIDDASVPPGSLYALSGQLTLGGASELVRYDRAYPFGIAQGMQADSATQWDRRPTLRKPCTSEGECGAAAGLSGACAIVCSPETLTCAGAPRDQALSAPDGYACVAPDGGDGICCQGACDAAGTCDACGD